VLDEQRVQRDPVPLVDRATERRLRLLGRPGADDPQPVRDPMDVRIDRDRREPEAEDEDAVGGLRRDRREGDQLVVLPRDLAAVAPEDLLRDRADRAALRPVEADRPDQRFQHGGPGPGETLGVGEPGEQASARDIGVRVAGPLGEDRADEDLERVLGVVAQVRPAPVAGPVERAQPVEERLPGEPRPVRGVAHLRSARPTGARAVGGRGPTPGSLRSGSSPTSSARSSSPIR